MPLFTYSATNADGQTVQGTIDAVSAQAARQAIADRGLQAVELHESTLQEQTTSWETIPAQPVAFTEPQPSVPQAQPAMAAHHEAAEVATPAPAAYFPITKTLALYCGWLLAYYCLVYAIGSYQYTRSLPFRLPYVEALLLSPLVLSFTLAAFLFLLLTSVHAYIGGGKWKGFFLTVTGVILFALYRVNVA